MEVNIRRCGRIPANVFTFLFTLYFFLLFDIYLHDRNTCMTNKELSYAKTSPAPKWTYYKKEYSYVYKHFYVRVNIDKYMYIFSSVEVYEYSL